MEVITSNISAATKTNNHSLARTLRFLKNMEAYLPGQ
jgi:hypothetical protein